MVEQAAVNRKVVGSNPTAGAILRQGYGLTLAIKMYYVYILKSSKSKTLYTGYTENLKKRIDEHNSGKSSSTKPHIPWELICYISFNSEQLAKDFERYLKSGSGRSFAYKRLIP